MKCKDIINNKELLDEMIIKLHKDGFTYAGIQLMLGNPSKRYISNVLKQYKNESKKEL